MKKILSVLLAAVMMVSCAAFAAFFFFEHKVKALMELEYLQKLYSDRQKYTNAYYRNYKRQSPNVVVDCRKNLIYLFH